MDVLELIRVVIKKSGEYPFNMPAAVRKDSLTCLSQYLSYLSITPKPEEQDIQLFIMIHSYNSKYPISSSHWLTSTFFQYKYKYKYK